MKVSFKAVVNTSLWAMAPDITCLTPVGDEIEERPQKLLARIWLGLSENSKKDQHILSSFNLTQKFKTEES